MGTGIRLLFRASRKRHIIPCGGDRVKGPGLIVFTEAVRLSVGIRGCRPPITGEIGVTFLGQLAKTAVKVAAIGRNDGWRDSPASSWVSLGLILD
jgi:hypothetical protein